MDEKTRLKNLIRADLITMNGSSSNLNKILVVLMLLTLVIGFLLTPVFAAALPTMTGTFFVGMLVQNEVKYHGEKLYCVLPVSRRELVRSRFLLSVGGYLAGALILYVLMLLAIRLKTYYLLDPESAPEIDLLRLFAARSGGSMTEYGAFNLCFFTSFALGLKLLGMSLHRYFRDNSAFSALGGMDGLQLRRPKKKELLHYLLIFGLLLLFVLFVTDMLPIGTAGSMFFLLLMQLAMAADGVLFCAVLVALASFSVIYKYIRTQLEYEEKEL